MVEDCKSQLFNVAILYSKCFIYNIYCKFKDLKRLSMASYEDDNTIIRSLSWSDM